MQTEIHTEFRRYLLSLFPDIEVIRGQRNRVSQPEGDHIVFNPVKNGRLSTNRVSYHDDPEVSENRTATHTTPQDFTIQLDFYGELSAERSATFAALFHSAHAAKFLQGISPLFCSEPTQLHFISEEKQYIDRWTVDAHLQFNLKTTVPEEFTETVTPNIQATETLT